MGIYSDGEIMYQPDYNNIVAAIKGDGVVDGEEVTATDPSSMNIVVGSGSHYISQTKYNINEQQLTISESDATYDRLDIVVAGTGGPSVVTGTAAETPKPPAIPSNSILLAIVRVPAGATAISNSNIYDRRIFVTMDAIQARVKKSGDTMSGSLTGITTLEADLLQVGGTEVISSSRVLKNISGDGNVLSSLNADLLDGYHASAFPLGGWELVEEIDGAGNVNYVDFTGLDGESDEIYKIVFWVASGNGVGFGVRFGYGATTWDSGSNYRWVRFWANQTGTSSNYSTSDTYIRLGNLDNSNYGVLYVFCKNTAQDRGLLCLMGHSFIQTMITSGGWTNHTNNLTGIRFVDPNGQNSIGQHVFTLFRKKL